MNFLDLSIRKQADFASSGRVTFATYTKPGWKPQYLSYFSEHSPSCKHGIYKGEARRHLLNCSLEADYDLRLAKLRDALRVRGYPLAHMPAIPYDPQLRAAIIARLYNRSLRAELLTSTSDVSDHRQQQDYGSVLPFKVVYNHQLRKLKLRGRINNLIKKLRWDLGGTFLQNTRIVLAHPVQSNVFMKTYRNNFLCDDTTPTT